VTRSSTRLATLLVIAGCEAADPAEPPPVVTVEVPAALGGTTTTSRLTPATAPAHLHHYGLPVDNLRSGPADSTRIADAALPASYDLSGWAPAVGNQGATESCQSWATGHTAMGWWANRYGLTSATFAPMYLFSQLSGSCSVGGYITDALAILKSQGIDTASDYEPMQTILDCSTKPDAVEQWNAGRFRISGSSDLDLSHGASTPIMTALASGKPVILGILVYPELENATATGYIVGPPQAGDTMYGGHAITAFAYDANGVWIENSWGAGWGDSGWAELSWDFIAGSFGGHANVQDAHTIDGLSLACTDSNADCAFWTSEAQCQENPSYMLANCCASCATAADAYRTFEFHPWSNTSACMDVTRDSHANRTLIEEYGCNGTAAQAFTELDDGNGLVTLYHPDSGKCLDVRSGGTANGTPIQLYTCNHTASQQFTVLRNSDSSVTFTNPHAQRCIDVTQDNPASGTALQLWDCNGTDAQRWTPAPR
jgi:hypothetical protein